MMQRSWPTGQGPSHSVMQHALTTEHACPGPAHAPPSYRLLLFVPHYFNRQAPHPPIPHWDQGGGVACNITIWSVRVIHRGIHPQRDELLRSTTMDDH